MRNEKGSQTFEGGGGFHLRILAWATALREGL